MKGYPLDVRWPEGTPEPEAGQIGLACRHPDRLLKSGIHVFLFQPAVDFRRPDGTEGTAHFLFICGPCFERYKDDIRRCPVGGEVVYHHRKLDS